MALAGEEKEQEKKAKKSKKAKKEDSDAETTDAPLKKVKNDFPLQDVAAWRKEHEMTISGNDSDNFLPLRSFADSGIPEDVLAITKDFKAPTPIQA